MLAKALTPRSECKAQDRSPSPDVVFSLSACPLCTRLGLQGHLNTTLTTLKDAQETADTVSNLEELWPELIKVEGLITEAQVRLSIQSFKMPSEEETA